MFELNEQNKSFQRKKTEIIDVELSSSKSDFTNKDDEIKTEPKFKNSSQSKNPSPILQKRKFFSFGPKLRFFLGFITILVLIFSFFGGKVVSSLSAINSFGDGDSNFLTSLPSLNPFASPEDDLSKIQGAKSGRVNILLLGNGGAGHDGALLTDTQLIVSIFPKEKKIATMNIPRDLYIKDEYSYKKINSVYADAETKQKGNGIKKISSILEQELGTKIHYWAIVDFKGFKDLVNVLGGVDIYVRNSFTDYMYPEEDSKGYGYMTPSPSFKAGWTNMDGKKALIYARSRHAAGVEGGDFARSIRQREIITAIVKKGLDSSVLTNLDKISALLEAVAQNMKTNLTIGDIYVLGKILKQYDLQNNVVSWTLDDSSGFLCPQNNPDTGYILTYCDGTYFGTYSKLSSSRMELQEGFADILNVGVKKKFLTTSIGIVSNKSPIATSVYNSLLKIKPNSNFLSNQNKDLVISAQPEVSVYLNDSSYEDTARYLASQNLGYKLNFKGNIPANKQIPKNVQQTKIIIWIE